MKITLISPYSNFQSYGIRSISRYLKDKGVKVSIIYLLNRFDIPYNTNIFNQLAQLCANSDLIGLSVMSNYFINSVQITKEIKKRLTTPIIWGGVHPTVLPEECLTYCDIAVIGEGEETLFAIVNNIKNNKPIQTIPGTFVKQNGKIYKNILRAPIQPENLVIPDQDYSTDFVLLKNRLLKIDYQILKMFMSCSYTTLTSFGCNFSCSYCINNILKSICGYKVRFKSVDNVISELISVKLNMPFIKEIIFEDDAFILRDIEELRYFAKEYKEKIHLPFLVGGINPILVTDEKIKLLISAGMHRVRMGIQSGSKESKIIYNRYIPNDKIIAAAKILNKYRSNLLLIAFDIIVDNPFESKEDVIETIYLLSKLPAPFTLNVFSLTFYPGTEIYQKAKLIGLIKNNHYKKQLLDVANNYLNFIIILYTVCKIPNWLLNILLNERIIKREIPISSIIFMFFKLLGYFRRVINYLVHGDIYTIERLLRNKLIKI